ncbi:exocyst complex component 8 isoform X2 [Neocloeon triangulifer]|uniref:exocyst complex component 8 isoform X2 n=1 Tax=Neocloeon triangulifer TaxID=2078957 RepID=UPI00286ED7D6|nr:exocyst complex component 8 isoform X2 [Neocloeon triangulifer]
MADISGKKISAPDFVPKKYVKELSQRCVGKMELVNQRQKMQSLSDETNLQLKRNVFQNYMQFIETAKEISHLESEMYQLSHLLSEQRELLSSFLETSIVGGSKSQHLDKDKQPEVVKKNEEEGRRKLASIIERVEGCVSLLDVPGRVLLHDSDLVELDINDNSAIQRYHGYLLNDSVVLASWIPNRRGPVRYKFQVQYPLDSLAVVNVRDLGNIIHAFKFLAFPDTRLFQCSSATHKQEWMVAFDAAKKSNLKENQMNQQRESVSERPVSVISRGYSTESTSPFDEPVADPTPEQLIPEWLLEAPDELDVCIAQRHFEDAYNVIVKCKESWDEIPPSPKLHLIQRKIESRVRTLTEVLMKELEVLPDRSFQGGLRAARRAVRLLNLLGCSSQACKLFLELSSSVIKTQLKWTMREGVTVQFITQLGNIFFSNIKDVMQEFLKSFPRTSSCLSSFIVWAEMELTTFVTLLNKHIFLPQSSLDSIADCFSSIRKLCSELCELGLDIVYILDGLLRSPLTRVIQDNTKKTIDSIRVKAADDTWRQTNLMSKDARTKLLQQFTDLGISNIHKYTYGETWLCLSSNTISFTKRYLQYVESLLILCIPELEFSVHHSLAVVLREQLVHVQQSVGKDGFDQATVEKNGNFLVGELLPLVMKKFDSAIGHPCENLEQLAKEFASLAPKSVTKYSTTVYI